MSPEVTILISSFDGYADCWAPVCHGFTKYWPDCPYPILLMTNTRDYPHERVKTLKVEGGKDWSARMLNALDLIRTPYVMYFQEDYWIKAPVDTSRIVDYVSHMEKHGLNYIRLMAFPAHDFDFPGDPRLGLLADQAPYRCSVQITLWRREVFRDLVRPQESVWQFEINGTVRSQKYGPTFLCTKKEGDDEYAHGIRYVCTAINAGKWARLAKVYAEQEGLSVDFSRLPSETWWDDFKRTKLGIVGRRWARGLDLCVRHPKLASAKLLNRLQGK